MLTAPTFLRVSRFVQRVQWMEALFPQAEGIEAPFAQVRAKVDKLTTWALRDREQ